MLCLGVTCTYTQAQTLSQRGSPRPTEQVSTPSDQTQSCRLKRAKWMTDEVKARRETRKSTQTKWSLLTRKHTHPVKKKKKRKSTGVQVSINLPSARRVEPHVFDKSSSRSWWGNDEVISVLWTGSNSLGRVHFKLLQAPTHTHTHMLCRKKNCAKTFYFSFLIVINKLQHLSTAARLFCSHV